jgi:hypothetical protein
MKMSPPCIEEWEAPPNIELKALGYAARETATAKPLRDGAVVAIGATDCAISVAMDSEIIDGSPSDWLSQALTSIETARPTEAVRFLVVIATAFPVSLCFLALPNGEVGTVRTLGPMEISSQCGWPEDEFFIPALLKGARQTWGSAWSPIQP